MANGAKKVGSFLTAAGGAASMIPGGQLVGGIMAGAGFLTGLFGGDEKSPSVQWDNMGWNDDYGYKADTNFGVGVAQRGYSDVDKYKSEARSFLDQSNASETMRLRKMAGDMTPGMAALRAGSGVNGGASRVIAKQQRESILGKGMDAAFGASEASRSRYDSLFMSALDNAEKLRLGYSGMEMDAIGKGTMEKNKQFQFNAGVRYDLDKFNTQGRYDANKTNSGFEVGTNATNSSFLSQGFNFGAGMLGYGLGYRPGQGNSNSGTPYESPAFGNVA